MSTAHEQYTPNNRPLRAIAIGFIVCLLVWTGWRIFIMTVADHHATDDAARALYWKPNASLALVAEGRRKLDETTPGANTAKAKALAISGMEADPLQIGALALLADVAEKNGDKTGFEKMLRLADQRSRRNITVQTKMIDLLVGEGDFLGAIERADVLLRSHPDYTLLVMKFLTNLTKNEAAYPAFAETLAKRPPWRQPLLASVTGQPNDPGHGLRLISAMAARGDPIDSGDMAPALNDLFKERQHREEAYSAWIMLLSQSKKRLAKFVYDGDFTQESSDVPFEWLLKPSPGASVDRLDNFGPSGRSALRVEFVGTRVSYLNIRQALHLSPGKYRMRADVRSEDLRSEKGAVWQIACWANPPALLGETKPVHGTRTWGEVFVEFSVPDDNCDFQELRLAVTNSAPSAPMVSGLVAFSGVAVANSDTVE